MNLEFNGVKLTGNSVSDIDLEIRDILEADLNREATEEEMDKARREVAEQIRELSGKFIDLTSIE